MTEVKPKRLYRSEEDRKIAGICGGLAEYFGLDPVVVRLGAIVLMVITGVIPMVIAYLVSVLIVPLQPTTEK